MSVFEYSYLNNKFYKHLTNFFPNSPFYMEGTLIQASTGCLCGGHFAVPLSVYPGSVKDAQNRIKRHSFKLCDLCFPH